MVMTQEDRIQADYKALSVHVDEGLVEALAWAQDALMRREGEGHMFEILPYKDGVCCTFSKPEWGGEHQSRVMGTGTEAVVMAVCEYINGA